MSHNWVLSSRSRERLAGVKPDLADTVKRALELSPIDFGVSEGKRTLERQKLLVSQGASQTMKSKHLTGDAADLVGYLDGHVSWEMSVYTKIPPLKPAFQYDGGARGRSGTSGCMKAAWTKPRMHILISGDLRDVLCSSTVRISKFPD
jgi:hypothetical protein